MFFQTQICPRSGGFQWNHFHLRGPSLSRRAAPILHAWWHRHGQQPGLGEDSLGDVRLQPNLGLVQGFHDGWRAAQQQKEAWVQATGNGDDNVDVTIVFLNLPQLENPPFASWCFLWCAFFGWDLNSSKCARKYWRSCKENNPAATVTFAESSCVRQVKIWARNQGYGTGAGIQAMVLRGSDLGLFRKIRTGVFWCFFEFLHWRSWTHHELMMLMGFEWIWCF